MKMLVGLICAVVGIAVAWWAFLKAVEGNDFYNWIWVPALFIGVFGIILIIARIRKWISE